MFEAVWYCTSPKWVAVGLVLRHPYLFIVFEEGHKEAWVEQIFFTCILPKDLDWDKRSTCGHNTVLHSFFNGFLALALARFVQLGAQPCLLAHFCQNEDTDGAKISQALDSPLREWLPILPIAVGDGPPKSPKHFPAPRSETPSSWKRRNSRSTQQPGIRCFSMQQQQQQQQQQQHEHTISSLQMTRGRGPGNPSTLPLTWR